MADTEHLEEHHSIHSREQMLATLGEAAEVEHNLMCCYLYAAFSLKTDESEGLTAEQVKAIQGWRRTIIAIAVEEMSHLALVCNLQIALGGAAHFTRGNFPIAPGFLPANITVRLAPFNMDTLDHFIFLERPETVAVSDGAGFEPQAEYVRGRTVNTTLMPMAGDYDTVGALYSCIQQGLKDMSESHGEDKLFIGSTDQQIGPNLTPLPGLRTIGGLQDALAALDTIVEQGEGAPEDCGGGHFARFMEIKKEYEAFLDANPDFEPGRPVADNPVMRRPPTSAEDRVWVTQPKASAVMDYVNALYIKMLRLLAQAFGRPGDITEKRTLITAATDLMYAMTPAAGELTRLPANDQDDCNAGMSFAMTRSVAPMPIGSDWAVLSDRFREIVKAGERLEGFGDDIARAVTMVGNVASQFDKRVQAIMSKAEEDRGTEQTANAEQTADPSDNGPEVVEGEHLTLSFDGKKCIHARFCVTGAPKTFLANVEGPWLHPDETHPDRLAAIAEACPSGAITVVRRDGRPDETAPEVNLAHIRENGPLAVQAEIVLNGKPDGFRRTLCRCGKSERKPYCDGSHVEAGFEASGEPESRATDMMDVRDGALNIETLQDGPLQISGPVEICAGTGRVVERTVSCRLCRCGASKNKPFCDNSHMAIGFKADGV
ncbi:MAG: ferritin-like domain-containing protein [Pseudomonadota bacterium]